MDARAPFEWTICSGRELRDPPWNLLGEVGFDRVQTHYHGVDAFRDVGVGHDTKGYEVDSGWEVGVSERVEDNRGDGWEAYHRCFVISKSDMSTFT